MNITLHDCVCTGGVEVNGQAPSAAAQKPGLKKGQTQPKGKGAAAKPVPAGLAGPALISDAEGLR